MTNRQDYDKRCQVLAAAMRSQSGAVALNKPTSNLFRSRNQGDVSRLDVRSMDKVIGINTKKRILEVEGMATYEDIVNETLRYGLMPPVVPQLKTITVGGGISGLAIESSSFREGLTHESVLEMDVLTADGNIITCSPTKHADLFYALPNSYGTLGYILRVVMPLRPVKKFVQLRHVRCSTYRELITTIETVCASGKYAGSKVDFVDGMIVSASQMYMIVARFVDDAPYQSDYTYMSMYWRSITEREEDYLTISDYIWRWDTDWFWCSKNVGAHHTIVRRLLGRKWLGSRTYSAMMRFESHYGLLMRLQKLVGRFAASEVVIQDVQLPASNVPAFLDFFEHSIGISPLWLCPTRAAQKTKGVWPWTLYPMKPNELYINVGFWDSVPTKHPPGYYNKLIEKQVTKLGGTKSLYSDAYYSKDKFDHLYNGSHYRKLKETYDMNHRFKDLYQKTVGRR